MKSVFALCMIIVTGAALSFIPSATLAGSDDGEDAAFGESAESSNEDEIIDLSVDGEDVPSDDGPEMFSGDSVEMPELEDAGENGDSE
jgi:hypothetical protein